MANDARQSSSLRSKMPRMQHDPAPLIGVRLRLLGGARSRSSTFSTSVQSLLFLAVPSCVGRAQRSAEIRTAPKLIDTDLESFEEQRILLRKWFVAEGQAGSVCLASLFPFRRQLLFPCSSSHFRWADGGQTHFGPLPVWIISQFAAGLSLADSRSPIPFMI